MYTIYIYSILLSIYVCIYNIYVYVCVYVCMYVCMYMFYQVHMETKSCSSSSSSSSSISWHIIYLLPWSALFCSPLSFIMSMTKLLSSGLSAISDGVSKARKSYASKHENSVLSELKNKDLSPADHVFQGQF